MKAEEYFIEDLPEPLTREEIKTLFIKYKEGDMIAREVIILHNLRLVALRLSYVYDSVTYDKKDLFSIGEIGLIKAVDTFDITKNIEFSTYAVRCIDNEINMFLRKLKREENQYSLESTIYTKDNVPIKITDTLTIPDDFILVHEQEKLYEKINQIIEDLPEIKKYVMKSYFGFKTNRKKQIELANELGYKQTGISNIIRRALIKIKEELEQEEFIEITNKPKRRIVKE